MRRQTSGDLGAAARRGIGGALLALLALVPGPARAARPESTITVRGRITDESGEGVPAQVVRLVKSRTIVKLGGLKSLDQSVEERRAATDPLGFFEIECPADPEFPYYYLRFYDPKGFDAVKYRLPEDREITKRVRQGRPVQVSVSRAGVAYLVEGQKVIETRTLPGGPNKAADEPGKKDEPEPAVRVDGP